MGIQYRLHRLIDLAAQAPGFHQIGAALYERRFTRAFDDNLLRGVYRSFDEAQASSPPTKHHGYDNDVSAHLYLRRLHHIAGDYPAMVWLTRSLREGQRHIVDLGGSVGIKYYAFANLIDYPADLRWTTVDVPAAVRTGRAMAETRDPAKRLALTDDFAAIGEADVLFASGSLQYIPTRLPQILAGLPKLPPRLIINTTPVHPTMEYYTLNNIGTAFCAYRIESHERLVAEVQALGYGLRDQWVDASRSVTIPGWPSHSFNGYSGFVFDLSGRS